MIKYVIKVFHLPLSLNACRERRPMTFNDNYDQEKNVFSIWYIRIRPTSEMDQEN